MIIATRRSQSLRDIAEAVINHHGKGSYQSFTQADISKLRAVGYDEPFKTLLEGVTEYMQWLEKSPC